MSGFEQPYFFWALLALPLLAMIYLWWRRSRRRMVSALFLWDQPEAARQSGTRLEWRRLPGSFYAEAAAVVLLILAATAPFWIAGHSLPVLTVMLDDSFSMSAQSPAGTPLELGRAELLRRVAEHPGRPVRIILAGTRVQQLGEYTGAADVTNALRQWRGEDAGGDLTRALALARSNQETGELLVISDRAPKGTLAPDVSWFAAGTPAEHVGIITARRWYTDGQEQLLVVVANYGLRPRTAELTLQPGNIRESFMIEGGEEYKFERPLADSEVPVTVTLAVPEDPLTADREVTLQSERRPPLKIRVTDDLRDSDRELIYRLVESNPIFTLAHGDETPEIVFSASENSGNAGEWHRVIFHPVRQGRPATEPFTVDRRHPLTEGVDLSGVRWYADEENVFPGLPVISGADMDLLSAVKRTNGYWDVHWNADFRASTLTRSTALPVIFWNLAHWLVDERPGPSQANYPASRELQIRLPRGVASAELTAPDGKVTRLTAQQGVVTCPGLAAGLWHLQAGEQSWQFAVQALNARESDLRISQSCEIQATELARERIPRHRFSIAALIAALGVLVLHQYRFGKWRGEL